METTQFAPNKSHRRQCKVHDQKAMNVISFYNYYVDRKKGRELNSVQQLRATQINLKTEIKNAP